MCIGYLRVSWYLAPRPPAGSTFALKMSENSGATCPKPREKIFAANPDQRVGLESIGRWSYLALGRITSINPVRVDCGILVEERAVFTRDPRVIGSFVGFRVEVLDAAG